MKKFRSKPPGAGAGAPTPAFPLGWGKRLLILVPVAAASSAVAWQSGNALGQLLAQRQLRVAQEGLPALESLSLKIALTLSEQGVCLDAPLLPLTPLTNTASRVDSLRDRFAVQSPCIDLALAQTEFETLQVSSATVALIQRRQSLTTGLLADSLALKREREALRLRKANRKFLATRTEGN